MVKRTMKKITKQDLANLVAEKVKISKRQAQDAVNAMIDGIASALEKKDTAVVLTGFGTFETREQGPRERLAFGKRVIKTPAKRVPKFKAGKTLKDRVERSK